MGASEGSSQGDCLAGNLHLLLKLQVDQALVCNREVAQMNRLRHVRCAQVSVDLIGDERNYRACNLDELHQDRVQGLVSLLFVQVALRLPESSSGAAHVPVVQGIQELKKESVCLLDVVCIEGFCHILDQ